MPYRISRLGTVEIRSLDLDRDLDYYVNVLGLQLTAREGRTAYLKGWDERHAYSLMLTEADRAGMVRLAFRTVDPEDLDYYERRLRAVRRRVRRDSGGLPPGTCPALHRAVGPHRGALPRDGLHGESPADGQSRAVAGGPEGHRAPAAGPYVGDRARAAQGDRSSSGKCWSSG